MIKIVGMATESGYHDSINHSTIIFSGGEVQVKINFLRLANHTHFDITAHLTDSNSVMELVMAVSAIRHEYPDSKIDLFMPYIPYARQDRVMQIGESLAIKSFAFIINSLNFHRVTVWDAHSDVSVALIDRCINVPVQNIWPWLFYKPEIKYLVSPDAGSLKKIHNISQGFKIPVIRADKKRSVTDGSITGTVVYCDFIGAEDVLIVDDICDGGRTFIELAKVLRPLVTGKINLYVTHGIFSQGLDVFDGIIDHIYCPAPFPGVDRKHKL